MLHASCYRQLAGLSQWHRKACIPLADHAHTAAHFTTSPTIAHRTLFTLTRDLQAYSPPTNPSTSHSSAAHILAGPTHQAHTPNSNICRDFNYNKAVWHTCARCQDCIYPRRTVQPQGPPQQACLLAAPAGHPLLELEHELCSFPDKGYSSTIIFGTTPIPEQRKLVWGVRIRAGHAAGLALLNEGISDDLWVGVC
jgi:hypothetical protein